MIPIEIDAHSGFCFGVVNAIEKAEKELAESPETLYCLGEIVHNSAEIARLARLGLTTVDYTKSRELRRGRILFRAHGEPPAVYRAMQQQGVQVIDATCPVVLKLQQRIADYYRAHTGLGAQIVIFGKHGHAEVIGLVGQTRGEAIVIQHLEEIDQIDFTRPVALFSQTTMPLEEFRQVVDTIASRMQRGVPFDHFDTICRQVAMRIPHIRQFAAKHTLVIFVAGKQSSNGRLLFEQAHSANPHSFFVSDAEEIHPDMLAPLASVTAPTIGICGATSTPQWQMQEVKERLSSLLS